MPTYDLECKHCGHKFSVFCSMSQKDQQSCPKCGSKKIGQRFTGVVIGGKISGGSFDLGSGNSCGTSSFG